ncbi:hypothetical protein ACQKP0_24990 [Heyndrickxia sp. NPDC080065]|uniref:hypothetical protein n=1 Tax=Heyndrickxia sp. NPDC080065 TaxID=3390568 RepID=UPI003D055156
MTPSNDGWKPTLSEFKLNPEQLERYNKGESIESILKGEKEVKVTMKLSKERYLALKKQGLADVKIIKDFGFKHVGELTAWKKVHLSPEEIEQLRLKTLIAKREGTVNESNSGSIVISDSKTINTEKSPEIEEMGKEIERLKREVIDAHKLLTEMDERLKDSLQEHLRKDNQIEKLQKQLDQSVELYESAMVDKENLHKENIKLENTLQPLKQQIVALEDRCDRYRSDYIELEEEVNGLRRFALTKLKRDVYPA